MLKNTTTPWGKNRYKAKNSWYPKSRAVAPAIRHRQPSHCFMSMYTTNVTLKNPNHNQPDTFAAANLASLPHADKKIPNNPTVIHQTECLDHPRQNLHDICITPPSLVYPLDTTRICPQSAYFLVSMSTFSANLSRYTSCAFSRLARQFGKKWAVVRSTK